ncbi:AsmA protein [Mesorhizobium microcysteis]|uniref:AsmA protein n=1 Tax=Neoaquamicrobium microcysteis TaxID=2682781 RepID=A0A5D4GU42_9HYPH|nr:AsmA protein [Mesorhizobium microcysteis]
MALVAPYFIDWTSYRADFEREASRILGRDVKVQGSANARLLPFPSVTFTDVVVAGVNPGETAMTVETFSMDAELAPFMQGDLHIFDMRLVRPDIRIGVGDDGAVDWSMRPSAPIGASHISLEKLTITEGRVSIEHAESGRTHQLTEINADISARALTGPWRMDGSLRLDGMRTALQVSTGAVDESGRMRLRVRAEPERFPFVLETDGAARIEEGGARYAGQFRVNASTAAQLQQAQQQGAQQPPAYRVSGGFDFDHRMLDITEFRFETGTLEDPYTADGSAQFVLGAEPRFDIRADGAQIRFEDAAGGEAGAGAALDQRLAAVREFLLDMPRPAIPGRVAVNLPAIVAGDTTVRDIHLAAEPSEAGWTVASLGATLPGRTTLEASGELAVADELGFTGSLLLAVGQPSGFATWLARDVDNAIRRLPAAGFSAQVELSSQRQAFRDLELVLGSARFRGEIDSRTPAGEEPSMTLKLDGDRLDVEGMTAFASLFVSDSGETRLQDRDIAFEITAGPVTAEGLAAETLDTALRLKDGQLEIDRLSIGGLAGANISATGSIKDFDSRPTGNLDATVIATDLEPLAATLAERFPENRLAQEMARRAALYPGLLEEASIRVVTSAAANGDGTSGLALSATGEAGGTSFTLTGSAEDGSSALATTPVTLELSARNEEAEALYALMGLPVLPLGMLGAGELELAFEGVPQDGGAARLSFSGDGLDLGFEGEASLRQTGIAASGDGRLEADDLEPWLVASGIVLPGGALGLPVTGSAQIDIDDGLLVLSGLSGEVAGAAVRGDINAQMREGLPHLTGALALESFDLASVAEMATGAAALQGGGDDWPTAPFAQGVATPLTADLDLAVDRLYAGFLAEARDARLTLRIGRDGIAVSDVSAQVYGGRISGLLDFKNDSGTGLLSSQLRLDDADLTELLGDVGLGGETTLTAALTASGKSIDGIVSALAGSGTVSVRDLSIEGVAPDAFSALLAEADKIGPAIDAAATAVFATDIVREGTFRADRADIAFTVANGGVRAPPLRLETDGATLSGEVRADLGQSTVGAEATLTFAAGQEALVGSEPSVRLVAAGPLDDIGVLVDTEPLAQFLTQRALELEQQRVEAMQASLLEKQRHRREVRYYAALSQERANAAEEARRAAEETERLERQQRLIEEGEAARRRAEEAARIEAERARAAEEADAAQRRAEEEEARQRREQEAERRRIEEQTLREQDERQRAEDERLREEVEALIRARGTNPSTPVATDPNAVQRQPLAPPGTVDVTPQLAPRAPEPRPQPAPFTFSEESFSVEGLMRALGENR